MGNARFRCPKGGLKLKVTKGCENEDEETQGPRGSLHATEDAELCHAADPRAASSSSSSRQLDMLELFRG